MKIERNRLPNLLLFSLGIGCVAGALLFSPGVASAQSPGSTPGGQSLFGIFYENGQATINGQPQQAFPDPTTGAPTWILPFSVVAGDVLGKENADLSSDLLRFPDVTGGGISDRVMLFSDLDADSPGDMADVGIPAVLQPNLVSLPEVGGFIDYDVPGGIVDYHVFSEVPEPTSLVLLGLGALLLRRRRVSI
jgi:hypothetical protein